MSLLRGGMLNETFERRQKTDLDKVWEKPEKRIFRLFGFFRIFFSLLMVPSAAEMRIFSADFNIF